MVIITRFLNFVYYLTPPESAKWYVVQTGRHFVTLFGDHFQEFLNNAIQNFLNSYSKTNILQAQLIILLKSYTPQKKKDNFLTVSKCCILIKKPGTATNSAINTRYSQMLFSRPYYNMMHRTTTLKLTIKYFFGMFTVHMHTCYLRNIIGRKHVSFAT